MFLYTPHVLLLPAPVHMSHAEAFQVPDASSEVLAWFSYCVEPAPPTLWPVSAGAGSCTFSVLWLSSRAVATSFTDQSYSRLCIQRLRRPSWLQKSRFEPPEWSLSALCDSICSGKAIQESLWSFLPHLWVLVLEGLKPGLPPHLLPLIRWIKAPVPPTPINAFSCSFSWPQLPRNTAGEIQWLPTTNPLLHHDWLEGRKDKMIAN